jgi:hypothetical protein
MPTHHRGLYLIIGVFAALVFTFNLNTPIFEGSDEPWHVGYIVSITRGLGLPLLSGAGARLADIETHQPPLYYLGGALLTFGIDTQDYESLLTLNPYASYDVLANDNKNVYLHGRHENWPYANTVLVVRLARLLSLSFGIGTLIATYGLARTLFPAWTWLGYGAAAWVAFLPQFAFISSVVTNDGAITCVTTCAGWQLARLMRGDTRGRRAWLWLGLWLGLAPLTKESGLVLWLLTALVLGVCAWRTRQWFSLIRTGASLMVIVGSLTGWWFVLRWQALGFWLGTPHSANPTSKPMTLEGLGQQWHELEISFWGLFGWSSVPLPLSVYEGLHWLSWLAALGLVCALAYSSLKHTRFAGGEPALKRWHCPLTPVDSYVIGALLAWIALLFVAYYQWFRLTFEVHGRLLFPALPAIALLWCIGITQWLPMRWRAAGLMGITISLAGLSWWSALYLMPTAFPTPTLLPLTARAQLPQRSPVHFEQQLTLLSYDWQIDQPSVKNQLTMKTYWETQTPLDKNYTISIQVFAPDGSRIGHFDTYPVNGMYVTSQWRVGEILQDVYVVDLTTPSTPLRADVTIGIYDRHTNKALAIVHPDGRRTARTRLGQIEIP